MEIDFSWSLRTGEVISLTHRQGDRQFVKIGDISTCGGDSILMANGDHNEYW